MITDIRHFVFEGRDKADPLKFMFISAAKWTDDGVTWGVAGRGATHDEAKSDMIRQLLERPCWIGADGKLHGKEEVQGHRAG
jgi:hypothetical protein